MHNRNQSFVPNRAYRGIIRHPRAAQHPLPDGDFRRIFVSADDLNSQDARDAGFREIVAHPNQVAELGAGDRLTIDYDFILMNDQPAALALAFEAVQLGVHVHLNTYYPDDPRLATIDQASSGLGQPEPPVPFIEGESYHDDNPCPAGTHRRADRIGTGDESFPAVGGTG